MAGAHDGGREGPRLARSVVIVITGALVLALACSRSEPAPDLPPPGAAPAPTTAAEPSTAGTAPGDSPDLGGLGSPLRSQSAPASSPIPSQAATSPTSAAEPSAADQTPSSPPGAGDLGPTLRSQSEPASGTPPSQAAPAPTSAAEPSAANQTPSSLPGAGDPVPPLESPSVPPPPVDTSIASVSLAEVVFDTFRGGFIRLSEATDDAIENLRDRIQPIYVPKYESANKGDWMSDEDMVIGFSSQSGALAYPVKMLNLHELVNDIIDGEPVLITYCPLCVSGVVYSRRLDDRVLLFGNTSALYESDLVMYDHETGSYWYQTLGEAIVGPLTGRRLTLLPSLTVPWGEWKQIHPDTRVLSRDLGLIPSLFGNPYDRDPFAGYDSAVNRGDFIFPVDKGRRDSRLRLGDRVLAVQVGDSHKAYLLTGRPNEAINDEVAGEKVVVIVREDGPSGSAYFRSTAGRSLTFRLDGVSIVDQETGSTWNFGGHAISGPLSGTQLEAVPSRTSYWFSLVALLPDVELHE